MAEAYRAGSPDQAEGQGEEQGQLVPEEAPHPTPMQGFLLPSFRS